jgi:hypothetical protein
VDEHGITEAADLQNVMQWHDANRQDSRPANGIYRFAILKNWAALPTAGRDQS